MHALAPAFRRIPLALIALLAPAAAGAQAFELTPMIRSFDPFGPGATHTFRLVSHADQPVAVELTVRSREVDLDGRDVLGAGEDEDFVVYPAQVILQPGRAQAVRVQWIGAAEIDRERAYRLIAEQLPIDLEPDAEREGASIRLLLRYAASLYVTPPGATPDVVVEAVDETELEGVPALAVTLHNRGTAHRVLDLPRLSIEPAAGGEAVTVGGDETAELARINLLAGSRRRVVLPRPPGLAAGPVRARLLSPRGAGDEE